MAEIIKRGESYTIRVSAGYDINNKQIKLNHTWTPDPNMTEKQLKKELQRQAVLFEEKVLTGQVMKGNIKFADFVTRWFSDYAEKHLAPKTVYNYKNLLNRINSEIGHIKLDHLKPHHLLSLYTKLAEEGGKTVSSFRPRDNLALEVKKAAKTRQDLATQADLSENTVNSILHGKNVNLLSAEKFSKAIGVKKEVIFSPVDADAKLSGNTVLHYHKLISSILQTAVEWQVIFSNPASRVKAPKNDKKESLYLNEDQAKILIEQLESEPIQKRTMITLGLYTGVRRGELCGLRWSDIDYHNKLIHIQRAIQYVPKHGIFDKPPKNESSVRVIKVPEIALKLLREYRAWYIKSRLEYGDQWLKSERELASAEGIEFVDPEYVFTKWNGSCFNPEEISKWFRGFIKRTGLPHATIHSLRHTNASLMIAAGTNIRTVSKRLGHAQTSTTTNIYSHAIRSADEAVADVLENIFEPVNRHSGSTKE